MSYFKFQVLNQKYCFLNGIFNLANPKFQIINLKLQIYISVQSHNLKFKLYRKNSKL